MKWLSGMSNWLRHLLQAPELSDDGKRIVRKGDRDERRLDTDPTDELAEIVGEPELEIPDLARRRQAPAASVRALADRVDAPTLGPSVGQIVGPMFCRSDNYLISLAYLPRIGAPSRNRTSTP
ncbi:MAG: hypothetical protein ACLPTZ_16625, partial [Beijerinckiaceae bacterium]